MNLERWRRMFKREQIFTICNLRQHTNQKVQKSLNFHVCFQRVSVCSENHLSLKAKRKASQTSCSAC